MTPSKESLQAVNNLYLAGILFQVDMEDGDCVPANKSEAAVLIDTAYAEHRERVKRLIRAATKVMQEISDPEDTDLPAALAALKEPP